MPKQKLVCIVGPTASGKTGLSIALAKRFKGEIVSADSMQIYKGMDIGTAKPKVSERDGIMHHMMDIISPFEDYSVARYVEDATAVIQKISLSGALPLVVGGTGLYIDSLLRGMDFAAFDGDLKYREELTDLANREGNAAVLEMLRKVDPEQAEILHANNLKRVIRALEVYKMTGETLSSHNKKTKDYGARYHACVIGLTFEDRQILYKRIDERVDQMINDGLLNEVRNLIEDGVPVNSTAMQAIGYKELVGVLNGKEDLESAVSKLKQVTRRYAKRQLTWFRRNQDINWIFVDKNNDVNEIMHASTAFMEKYSII